MSDRNVSLSDATCEVTPGGSLREGVSERPLQVAGQHLIRVLHVGPGHGQRGGIASVLEELASFENLAREGGLSFSFFETHGFGSLRHALRFLLRDIPRFALAAMRGIDIVHFHVSVRGSFYRKWLLFLIARMNGKKTIFHLHAGNFRHFEGESMKVVRQAISWFIRRADATVAVSTAIADELRALGANPGTLHIVGNTAYPAESISNRTMASDDCVVDPYIAFAGRLTKEKGLDDLLKAIAMLGAQGCFVRLRLAGSGDVAHWSQVVRELGIDDRVTFVGWLSGAEKLKFYRNAQVFCMPSHYESFGITTLEAMFSGVPVVGTRLGGFLDLVEEGVTGYLVEAHDCVALATRIRSLIETPTLAASMGKAALARASKNYSRNSIIALYIDCYRLLAGNRGCYE
ncbi:glycosyltransferase family 4 protein [Paraburkholderia sp.]|uniref:glycosyltransferase family 4 protein n=1 Tax=Paraburkholderia sp. TaxID=1926495 RepID=UPI003D6FEC62